MAGSCPFFCSKPLLLISDFSITDALAYFTAKTNGLTELAEEIMELAGLTDEEVPSTPVASSSKSLGPPPVITSQADRPWPSRNVGESFFDKALASGAAEISLGEVAAGANKADEQEDGWMADELAGEDGGDEVEDDDEGWGLDAEIPEPEVDEEVPEELEEVPEGVSPGMSEDEQWTKNSPLAADHAAAGSFETAMQVSLSLRLRWVLFPTKCSYSFESYAFTATQPTSRGCQLCPSQTPLFGRLPIRSPLCPRQPLSPGVTPQCPS